MGDDRIRVGVVLDDGETAPAWVAELLGRVRDSDWVKLVVVARRVGEHRRQAAPSVWWLFGLLDRWAHAGMDDAFARRPLASTLSGVRSVDISELAATSAADRLDVVLDLSERGPATTVAAAIHGSWSVDGGPPDDPRAFWALYRREPSTEVRVRRTGVRGDDAIARAHILTDRESVFRTTSAIRWKSGTLVMRCLRQLQLQGSLPGEPEERAPHDHGAPTPAARAVASVALHIVVTFVRRRALRSLGRHTWFLAVRPKDWRRLAERDDRGFRAIVPPRGHFYADPFLFEDATKTYVFFEDFIHSENKAVISCAEVTSSGLGTPRVVLRADHHLSYPFVFRRGDTIYMLPESTRARRLDLFRAVDFPWRWEFERTLLADTHLADATLLEHDGLLWLFGTAASHGGNDWEDLHIFYASTLEGNWTPHPLNPVLSDVRSARPAGRIFVDDGALIRPAQDCSVRYGYAMTLNRIDLLTTTGYSETRAGAIDPGWYPGNTATHTIDHTEHLEVIDGRAVMPRGRGLPSW
jgi:hypothetical protein